MRQFGSCIALVASLLFASVQAQGPVLAWDHPGGAETFRIEIGKTRRFTVPVPKGSKGRYYWNVPEELRELVRSVSVSACNAFGCSPTKVVTVKPPVPVVPPVITNLAAQTKVGVLGTNLPVGTASAGTDLPVDPPTDLAPPETPTNLLPVTGSTTISVTPTLSFTSSGAENYNLYFSINGGTLEKFILGGTASFTFDTPLLTSTTYQWQPEGCNVNPVTHTQQCTVGPLVTFSTVTPVPAPSNLLYLSPVNGSTAVSTSPTLTCSATDASSYYILGPDATDPPTTKHALGSVCAYSPAAMPYSALRYWRMCATNVTNTTCAATSASFTTIADPGPGVVNPPDCLSTTLSATGVNHFAFTSCRQDTWNRMEADYYANTAAPATRGGQWYRWVHNRAERKQYTGGLCNAGGPFAAPCYADTGQYAAFVVAAEGCGALHADGITRMADIAYFRLDAYYDGQETLGYWPSPYGFARKVDKNNIRNLTMHHLLSLDIIKPCITTPEYDRIKVAIAESNQGGLLAPTPHYLNLVDSDNTIVEYFNSRIQCLLEPTYQLALDNCANVNIVTPSLGGKVGGLDAVRTPAQHIAATSGQTARDSIRTYVEFLSEDGGWMEGNHYDPETVNKMIMGADAIQRLTGVDHYPEITSFKLRHAPYLLQLSTPDLKYIWDRVDLAEPRTLGQRYLLSSLTMVLSGMLNGTTLGEKLQAKIIEMGNTLGMFGSANSIEPNSINEVPFFFYDPYQAETPWRDTLSFTDRYARFAMRKAHVSNTNSCQFFSDFFGTQRWVDALNRTYQVHHSDNLMGWGTWDMYCGEYKVTDVKNNQPRAFADGANSVLVHGRARQGNVFTKYWEPTDHANFFAVSGTTGGQKNYGAAYCGGGVIPDIFLHEDSRRQVYFPSVSGTQLVFTHDRINALTTVPSTTCYTAAENAHVNNFDGLFGPVFLVNHMLTLPSQAGNDFTFASLSGTGVKMSLTSPATATATIVNEKTQTTYFAGWAPTVAAEKNYHVKLAPVTPQQWNTFHTVHQILPVGGSYGVVTPLTDAGKCEGAHVTRTGEADAVALFNTTQGANLANGAANVLSHDELLALVRFRTTGCQVSWTSVQTTTYVVLNDLSPTKTWTYTINGGGATALTSWDSVNGVGYIELSGSGAKALVVTAN